MRRTSGSIALLACLYGSAVAAQTPAPQPRDVIRGTVVDSVTGAPVVGAKVAVRCPTCSGRIETDSLGRYAYGRLPNGYWRIEFHCPSRTGLGRELAVRSASVGVQSATVTVLVPPGTCDEPPYREHPGVFRGHWQLMFEGDRFDPCPGNAFPGTPTLAPAGFFGMDYAWPTLSPPALAQFGRWRERLRLPPQAVQTYFVEWRGTLRGPGRYGHGGVTPYGMAVDSILEIRSAGARDCERRRGR